VIASVVGTVLTAISSMVIGFNGNLLVGLGVYLAALTSAIAAARITTKTKSKRQSGG
jgi:branched-subunit amino acid permease